MAAVTGTLYSIIKQLKSPKVSMTDTFMIRSETHARKPYDISITEDIDTIAFPPVTAFSFDDEIEVETICVPFGYPRHLKTKKPKPTMLTIHLNALLIAYNQGKSKKEQIKDTRILFHTLFLSHLADKPAEKYNRDLFLYTYLNAQVAAEKITLTPQEKALTPPVLVTAAAPDAPIPVMTAISPTATPKVRTSSQTSRVAPKHALFEKFSIPEDDLSADQFVQNFMAQYASVRKKEDFRFGLTRLWRATFGASYIDHKIKKMTNVSARQKMDIILQHAKKQGEKSKSYKALLQLPSMTASTAAVLTAPSTPRDAAAASLPPTAPPSPREPMDRGPATTAAAAPAYVFEPLPATQYAETEECEERTEVLPDPEILKKEIATAKKILDGALCVPLDCSTHLMGRDACTLEAREQLSKELVDAYETLKNHDPEAAQHYRNILQKTIYPHFLQYVVYKHGKSRSAEDEKPFLRYGCIEALGKASGTLDPALLTLSTHRKESAADLRVFSPRTPFSAQFTHACQIAWARTPLSVLADAGCVDLDEKHLKKEDYLLKLLQENRFDEALTEAHCLAAAFPDTSLFSDPEKDEAALLQTLKSFIATQVTSKIYNLFTQQAMKPEDIVRIYHSNFNKMEEILNELLETLGKKESRYYTLFKKTAEAALNGVIMTAALQKIAKDLNEKRPLDPRSLSLLTGCGANPFYWVGDDVSKPVLARTADDDKFSGPFKQAITAIAENAIAITHFNQDGLQGDKWVSYAPEPINKDMLESLTKRITPYIENHPVHPVGLPH